MRKIKIYGLTFVRTQRFAPECYNILDEDGAGVAHVSLQAGLLTLRMQPPVISSHFAYTWEVADLNVFHTEERRDKWLTKAAEKFLEVRSKYGNKS